MVFIKIKFIRDQIETETEETIKIDRGMTVDRFLETRGIEREEVLVSRNGTIISGKHQLESGDEIKVMDVIAGG